MEKFSTLHSGYADIDQWVVVSSNETLEIAMSANQPRNLSSLAVDGVHPAFGYTWTAVSLPPRGGAFTLPPMTPTHGSEYLDQREMLDYTTVNGHLQGVLTIWIPTIGAEARPRLRSYMPLLQQLVKNAGWTVKDESFYKNEEAARAEMHARIENLQQLAE